MYSGAAMGALRCLVRPEKCSCSWGYTRSKHYSPNPANLSVWCVAVQQASSLKSLLSLKQAINESMVQCYYIGIFNYNKNI